MPRASAQNKDSARLADAQLVRSPTVVAGLLLPRGIQGAFKPNMCCRKMLLLKRPTEPRRTQLQASPGVANSRYCSKQTCREEQVLGHGGIPEWVRQGDKERSQRRWEGMDFLFGKTFPADAPGGEEKAKTCQPRACTRAWPLLFGTHTHAEAPLSWALRKKKRLALGTNARPARFRPGLVEERQEWDESFLNRSVGPLKLPSE